MTFCALPYRAYNIVETPPIDPPTTSVMIQNIAATGASASSSTTITTTAGRYYLISGHTDRYSVDTLMPVFDGTAAGISSISILHSRTWQRSDGWWHAQYIFGGLCTTSSTGAITSNRAVSRNIDEAINLAPSPFVQGANSDGISSTRTGDVVSTTLAPFASASNVTYMYADTGGSSNPETGYTMLHDAGYGVKRLWKGSPDTSPSITCTNNANAGWPAPQFAIMAVELAAST